MEQAIDSQSRATSLRATEAHVSTPAYQAYLILRTAFTVAPIVAGLDKFLNLLVNWEQYLLAVGVIEIIAGIGVSVKPKIFAYVVCVWLLLIVINLLMIPGYFDVALRDFGLALGALALARLSSQFDRRSS
ncbi:MAG: hypothetical protein DMF69_02295 [Acidobacteria bacterium]|nr:MAG: hypothetical protein DMF69_02295 [Acidobacteriota bacterium]